MCDDRPLVSIGMPVYNGEKYIRQALDSLLAQEYENFEVVISDNASTDNTGPICKGYVKRDSRVIYLRNEQNLGAPYNFKRVLDESSGEYFMWASCHDVWEPQFISKCLQPLIHKPTLVLCFPSADWIDLHGRVFEKISCSLDTQGLHPLCRAQFVLLGLQYAYPVYGIFRSKSLKKVNVNRTLIGIDVIILFEIAFLGEFCQIPEVLIHIRRMEDYGSWEDYVTKIYNKSLKNISLNREVWKMLFAHFSIVVRYCRPRYKLVPMVLGVFSNLVIKYSWLWRAKKQQC